VDVVTFPVGRGVDIPRVRVVRTFNPLRFRHVPIGLSARKLVLDLCLMGTTYRLLKRRRYFSVHGVEEGGFIAAVLGRRFGVPVVYEMQSSLPEQLRRHRLLRFSAVQRALRACERWLLRRVDVVACSMGLGELVRRAAPTVVLREWLYPAPSGAVADGVVDALRGELRIAPDAPVVLYSGTFERYQGLADVLAAMPRIRAAVPGAVLVLVGAESGRAAGLLRHAASLGLDDGVRVVARRPREQMAPFFALADVLLAPRAAGANLPLKLFHYMAAGRAIVATGAGRGHARVADTRVVVVRHDAPAIADAVARLLHDRRLASDLGARARAFAQEHLQPSHFAASVRELCLDVSGRGVGPCASRW
jgi:glycosyltransferase involved in cell wall biosynthesis